MAMSMSARGSPPDMFGLTKMSRLLSSSFQVSMACLSCSSVVSRTFSHSVNGSYSYGMCTSVDSRRKSEHHTLLSFEFRSDSKPFDSIKSPAEGV